MGGGLKAPWGGITAALLFWTIAKAFNALGALGVLGVLGVLGILGILNVFGILGILVQGSVKVIHNQPKDVSISRNK